MFIQFLIGWCDRAGCVAAASLLDLESHIAHLLFVNHNSSTHTPMPCISDGKVFKCSDSVSRAPDIPGMFLTSYARLMVV